MFLPGYHTRSIGSWYEGDVTTQAWFLVVETEGTAYISGHERRDLGYFPEAFEQGQTRDLRGEDARLWTDGDLLHLAWREDDAVVHLVARGVAEEDLVAIAESMELSEGTDSLPGPDDDGQVRFGPGPDEEISLPPPFFIPTYIPDGYAGRFSQTSDPSDRYSRARFLLVEPERDGYVVGEQHVRADGTVEELGGGEPTSVNGREAWFTRSEDTLSLAWMDGDIVIVLTANRLSDEELLRMAESMQVGEATGDPPAIAEEPPSGEGSSGGETEIVPTEPDSP
jgi:hypothetical protein